MTDIVVLSSVGFTPSPSPDSERSRWGFALVEESSFADRGSMSRQSTVRLIECRKSNKKNGKKEPCRTQECLVGRVSKMRSCNSPLRGLLRFFYYGVSDGCPFSTDGNCRTGQSAIKSSMCYRLSTAILFWTHLSLLFSNHDADRLEPAIGIPGRCDAPRFALVEDHDLAESTERTTIDPVLAFDGVFTWVPPAGSCWRNGVVALWGQFIRWFVLPVPASHFFHPRLLNINCTRSMQETCF